VDLTSGKNRGVLVIMLSIDSITMAYGENVAINNVSFEVYPGEVLALIGPNGAGKSTLIRGISGVHGIRSGSIRYDDRNLTTLSPLQRARILAVVSQVQHLGGAFTAEQTVMLGRTAYMNWLGKAGRQDLKQVQEAIKHTNLEMLRKRRLAELSGGEQQRVFLARALAQDTPVMLLDEPTNHLDLHHQVSFLSLLRHLVKEKKTATLLALHDLNLVALYSDRVILLVEGEIVAQGKPEDVLTETAISEAYGLPVKVIRYADNTIPFIIPDTRREFLK